NSNVLAISLDQGEARVAATDPDYGFDVLGTHGSDLILRARSQRGTNKFEIWAVNATSGDVHWKFSLGENPPLDPGGIIDDDQPMWMTQPAADGLRVLRFKGASDNKSYAILLDTLNWDTGLSAGQKSTPF